MSIFDDIGHAIKHTTDSIVDTAEGVVSGDTDAIKDVAHIVVPEIPAVITDGVIDAIADAVK
jgi:hypothetical protein